MEIVSRRLGTLLVTLAVIVGGAGRSRADLVVYATISQANTGVDPTFGTLDLTTGRFTAVASLPSDVMAMTTGPGGELVAARDDGHLYTVSPNGVLTQLGSGTATLPPGGTQYGYYGLAYSAAAGGFIGLNLNNFEVAPALDRISADGNTVTPITDNLNPAYYVNGSGALSYAPDGSLYLVAGVSYFPSAFANLLRVDPNTGAVTVLNDTGLGTYHHHELALVNVAGQLYGVDSPLPAGPASLIYVYTIDTTTGLANNTGVTVTGLPTGYNIDAVGGLAVPEPSSLVLLASAAPAALAWAVRRRRARAA